MTAVLSDHKEDETLVLFFVLSFCGSFPWWPLGFQESERHEKEGLALHV
jgi:hypothetical protein